MNTNTTTHISENELSTVADAIGNLIIKNGLSYNQTANIFNLVLEKLKDVPYSLGTSRAELVRILNENPDLEKKF